MTARLYISAAHKSSGKTTVSIGLAAAFAARGTSVQCFKKGPDYIDPMWLAHASGRPCFNLDFNTQKHDEILRMVASRARGADVALIEGNKGLHDGVDIEGSDCSAALAKLTRAPVVLVIDVLGITRGIAPLLLGYQAFDTDVHIAGVILNKVSVARQVSKLRQAIERYTDFPVLGALPRNNELAVTERHLGLMTPSEAPATEAAIAAMRRTVEAGVDLDRVLAAGKTAVALKPPLSEASAANISTSSDAPPRVRVAIARDAAFGFYYADDLEAFERAGAELCFFDALSDACLPKADGLFIGGGFPETHAARLSANASLRADIAAKLHAGMPAYAECGGLMYLCRSIRWGDETHEMVGVIPADAVMHQRPQGRGLVFLEEMANFPWTSPGGAKQRTQAHEFHYAALENLDQGMRFAWRIERGAGIKNGLDGLVNNNFLAGFSHLRSTETYPWVEHFVEFIRINLITDGCSDGDSTEYDK
ncbi:MAG: cobyrinate a,c-diamide synthase [Alphaproteobacteria bacterium]